MKYCAPAIALFLLSSCSTYRSANETGYSVVSGGYTDKKLEDGIFLVNAESGVSPISQKSGVTRTWTKRANELCLGEYKVSDFEVKTIDQGGTYMSQGLIGYYVTIASGYAICSSYKGTYDEALAVINAPSKLTEQQLEAKRELLLSKTNGDCGTKKMDVDALEKAGNEFYEVQLYKEALSCYLEVYEKDKKELTKTEIYYRIGLMYELGLGVKVSIKEAKKWYKLSGLI
ncbi:SEL1-like repeat protein [Microbulbifer sp. DLAB2-AF]|uniref:SEL1-like repeat protein n=1 Tax=Microbulbifer sp. DLAB2-AF TaxID=3243395 RepID=UPI004039EA39